MRDDGRSMHSGPTTVVHVATIPFGLPRCGRVTGRVLAVTGKTAILLAPAYGEIVFQCEPMPSYVTGGATVHLTLSGSSRGEIRPVDGDPAPITQPFMPGDEFPETSPVRSYARGARGYRSAVAASRARPLVLGLYATHAEQANERLEKVIGRAGTADRLVRGRFEALLPRSEAGMAAALTNMLAAICSGGLTAWLKLEGEVAGADTVMRTVSIELPGMGGWQAVPFPFLTRAPISWGWLAWKDEIGIRKAIFDLPRPDRSRFQVRAASAAGRLDILVCLPSVASGPPPAPITFQTQRAIARELGLDLTIRFTQDQAMLVDLSRACRIDMEM